MGRRWSRVVDELPERVTDPNRSGVAVVGVLFGLVLGVIATGMATAVRAGLDHSAPSPNGDALDVAVPHPGVTIAHHSLAFVLVVTSFVGYFASKHGPQLALKFFNVPFWLIALDSAMVGSYFLLAQYAEGEGGDISATPEAVFVTLSFGLYAVWDLLGHRLQRDPQSQLARGRRMRDDGYGWRRWTTLIFLAGLVVALVVLPWAGLLNSEDAIAVDLWLIGVLFAYRITKSAVDHDITFRGQSKDTDAAVPSGVTDAAWYRDCSRLIPPAVWANIDVLKGLDRDAPAAVAAPDRVLSALEAAGAIVVTGAGATAQATLTEAGAAYREARVTAGGWP